jgi:hypothetical protein
MFKVFSPGFDPTVNSPFHIFKRIFQNLNSCGGFGYSTRKLGNLQLPFTVFLPFSVLKITLRKKNVIFQSKHFDNLNEAVGVANLI